MSGGGGGDDGYSQRQAEIETKKQRARDALNAQFGTYDPATLKEKHTVNSNTGTMSLPGFSNLQGGTLNFDEAGYNKEAAGLDAAKAARSALYQTVRDNAYTAGKRGLDENKDAAGRALRFELFAKGLTGGSEDVNQNALLGRTYSNGLLDLGGKADSAKAQFQNNDESTRLNLLQSIDAGMDQGSALSSANAQLLNNNNQAAADAQGTTLGDLFANTALISNQSQYRQGKTAGTEWYNNYAPSSSRGGSKSATGVVTGV